MYGFVMSMLFPFQRVFVTHTDGVRLLVDTAIV